MRNTTDIMVVGTGSFAARILFDLAATTDVPTRIVVAGRKPARLAWLETASRARADMFRRPVEISTLMMDASEPDRIGETLSRLRPALVLQAASLQPGSVIAAQGNAWSRLVAAGGLSASAVFQTVLTARVARACQEVLPGTQLVNACFPDVANGLVAAMGLPVTCGIGNIQILAHAFAGSMPARDGRRMQVLAHYQNLAAWRRSAGDRSGPNARVWLDDVEVSDLYTQFRAVQLTPEPVIDVSGAAAAPLLLALAHRHDWRGHVPGPDGLPGGYPVLAQGGRLSLDLPSGLTRDAAARWNRAHEETSGLVVDATGAVRYTGRLYDELAAVSPDLARGFNVRDLETVFGAMQALRERLLVQVV